MSNEKTVDNLLGDHKEGLIFIVSAPAGTGKTTLVQRLASEFSTVVPSISFTTRPPREGEKPDVHYHFITETAFLKKIADGDFLEYVKLYDTYYGTSLQWVLDRRRQGKHVVLVIDTQGALALRGKIATINIFVKPPSLAVLRDRLSGRQTEAQDMVEKRLKWAEEELQAAHHYDYQIVNDHLDDAYQVLKSIVIAECHRVRE